MSRDIAEIKEIRKEKANLEKLIESYQRRNEELKMKEAILIKKAETFEPGTYNWREVSEGSQNPDGYILSDSTFEILKAVETPQSRTENIAKLREKVIQKQYENLKLEKELEARKEEHREFCEMLTQPKSVLNQSIEEEYTDFDTMKERIDSKTESGETSEALETKGGDEVKAWDYIGSKYDL